MTHVAYRFTEPQVDPEYGYTMEDQIHVVHGKTRIVIQNAAKLPIEDVEDCVAQAIEVAQTQEAQRILDNKCRHAGHKWNRDHQLIDYKWDCHHCHIIYNLREKRYEYA